MNIDHGRVQVLTSDNMSSTDATPDVTLVQEIAVELVNLVVSTDGGRSLFGSLVRLMSKHYVMHVGTHTISSVT